MEKSAYRFSLFVTPSSSAAAIPNDTALHEHFVQTLGHLASLAGVPFDRMRASQGLHNAARGASEPLERLSQAAGESGLRLTPVRMSLADAVWRASDALPLVVWSAPEQRWLVLRKHGFFRVRITSPEHPTEPETLGRLQLARRLGLEKAGDLTDIGLVAPALPMQGLASDPHHGHGEHVSPVRRFLALMRPERQDVGAVVVFSLVTGFLHLALPLAVNALVSNLAFGGQTGPLWTALLVMAFALTLALMLSAMIRAIQYYLVEIIQRRLFVRLAADLSHRLPRVRATALDGLHAPELVNRFLDVVTVQKSTALMLLDGINIVLGMVVGMIVLGLYHPFLLGFVLLLIGLLLGTMLVFGRGAVRTSVAESVAKYEVVSWLEELARYPRLFKGPGGYGIATDRADELTRRYLENRRSHFRVLFRQIGGLLVMEVVASAALLIVGGWLVISQELTLGQLVASELIVGTIVASLSKLGKKFEAWYDTMAAMDKLGHLVDLPVEREDGEYPATKPQGARLEVSGLAYTYPHGVSVFSGLAFTAEPGERVALTGSQGSGSSTLLDILHGGREPTDGFIRLDGLDLRSWYLEALREQVALVCPDDIFQGSVVENVRLGNMSISLDEVTAALDRVGLLRELLELPEGVNTPLITGGLPLSSRQRIRLVLARALVAHPRLLLLDEVFDGLDEASLAELCDLILDPARPWTVLVATRDPAVIARCRRVLDLGRLNAVHSCLP
jgi:ABC-type bacteriocin/lantibiotic exporter with double-glycine peptidase domain